MSKEHDNDMENLSKAIVEAILASEDVKQALEKLNTTDDVAGKNFMVFMVSLDSLTDARKPDKEAKSAELIPEMPKPKRRKPVKKSGIPELIDGKPISPNEKKFHDFIAEKFDSETWLKRLRLKLE